MSGMDQRKIEGSYTNVRARALTTPKNFEHNRDAARGKVRARTALQVRKCGGAGKRQDRTDKRESRLSRPYSTSMIISISTGMLKGNSAIPTAERACLPIASPKTSTMRSEKPLMTFG